MADTGELPALIVPKHHKTLAMAFLEAQMEFGPIYADGINPEKGYRFRSFSAIRDALAPVLHKNGLCFTQLPDGVEEHAGRPTFMLKTIIMHAKTGAEMVGRYPICDVRLDAHAKATCLTLARRYSLPTIMGVSAQSEEMEPAHANGDPEGIDQRPPEEIAEASEPVSAFIHGEAWGLVENHYTALFAGAETREALDKSWTSFLRKYWTGKRRCISDNSKSGIEELYERAKLRLEDGVSAFDKITAAIANAPDLHELEAWRADATTETRFAKLSDEQHTEAQRLYEAAQERFADAYAQASAHRTTEPDSASTSPPLAEKEGAPASDRSIERKPGRAAGASSPLETEQAQ